MFEHMEKWLGGLGSEETRTVIQALTKVRSLRPEDTDIFTYHLVCRKVSEMGPTNDLALRRRLDLGVEVIATVPQVVATGDSKGKINTAVVNVAVRALDQMHCLTLTHD
jgi:hypothetical protein